MTATISNNSHNTGSITATESGFTLLGGLYGIAAVAGSWGTNAQLCALGPDGSTYVPVSTVFTANGYVSVWIPPGTYAFVLNGSFTAFYGSVTSVPVNN